MKAGAMPRPLLAAAIALGIAATVLTPARPQN